jgi:hypothetical protein
LTVRDRDEKRLPTETGKPLNAIRNTAPTLPEILNRYGYDDDATGD